MRIAATSRGFRNGSMSGGGGGRMPSVSWEGDGRRRCVRMPARSLPFAGEFAALGLTPFASRSDVKRAYKRLALKYHPDVIRGDIQGKDNTFTEIKSAYESLMVKFEEDNRLMVDDGYGDEWEEWDEWMGFEGGLPVVHNAS
ncbi:chaperone protein dnaJ 8, chloroplastic isoform X2 [Canna indica]|uniref:Chaperone protein dnaJ 8, chloroplastic isoform X2 n=1 Tax=Canna indica TaxID=4628 RepID=A0AAQ3QN81_9LILI|nr:chaperone protein dnaJ 8, chloroplastic isoform X2 [Canna indica]